MQKLVNKIIGTIFHLVFGEEVQVQYSDPGIQPAKYIKINKEIMEGSIDDKNFNSW